MYNNFLNKIQFNSWLSGRVHHSYCSYHAGFVKVLGELKHLLFQSVKLLKHLRFLNLIVTKKTLWDAGYLYKSVSS